MTLADEDWDVPFSGMLSYDATNDACLLANGNWRSSDASTEGLDYFSGQRCRIPLPDFVAPPKPKPRSHTAGRAELVAEYRASHNLPALVDGYVERPVLEDDLLRLLGDHQHGIVTMHGAGGAGKTSLVLKVCHDLVSEEDCPFELVLWFSARDIDLLIDGPRERRREVTDIIGVAEMYCRMLGGREQGQEALSLFGEEIGDSTNSVLLVMDNFETLDDPLGAYEYLDATAALPNKIVVTSRHREFRGYWVEVPGMELPEAEQLLVREARRAGCEPKMTAKAIHEIWDYTQGRPYAMKLVAAQMGRNVPLHQLLDVTLADERVLDSLFKRSFATLSDGGKRLFLVAGNLQGDVSILPLKASMSRMGLRVEGPLSECEEVSLVEVVGTHPESVVRMPQVAKKFAVNQLPVANDRLEIEREIGFVRTTYRQDGRTTVDGRGFALMIAELIDDVSEESERDELLMMLETVASESPDAWPILARLHRDYAHDDQRVRDAFEQAARACPDDGEVWQDWARFESQLGSERRAIELLIAAAERDRDNIGLNSHAANRVNNYLRSHKEDVPPGDRAIWTRTLIDNLCAHFDALHPDPLSRLAWLALNNQDTDLALKCVNRALELDPEHEHSLRLRERLSAQQELVP